MSARDIGAYFTGRAALANTTATTASVTTNGLTIDRRESAAGFGSNYLAAKVQVLFQYTKATGPTASVAPSLQHSSTSTAWVTLSTGAAVTLAATTTGTNALSIAQFDADLTAAMRYVRMRSTQQLTVVSSVNALTLRGVIQFGSADVLPAT
jgi:hypothetical protein